MIINKKSVAMLTICMIIAIIVGLQCSIAFASESQDSKRPIYLIDENFSFFPKNNLPSGWDVKSAGGQILYKYCTSFQIIDQSEILPIVMKKVFKTQTAGKITLEYRFNFTSFMDVEWQLLSDNATAVNISVSDKTLYLNSKDGKKTLASELEKGKEYGIKIIVDIDNNLTDVYVNGVLMAKNEQFKQNVKFINAFEVRTKDDGVGDMYFWYVRLYKNYIVNEQMLQTVTGNLPQDWVITKTGDAVTSEKMNSANPPDIYSFKLNDTNNNDIVGLSKSFEPQSDAIVLEYNMYMPKKIDGVMSEIKAGENIVVAIGTDNGKLGYKNSEGNIIPIYDYLDNLWVSVRVKFSLDMKTATIYINGKEKAKDITLLSDANGIDSVSFKTSKVGVGEIWLDDIFVYNNLPLPEDYVKAPMKASDDPYIVGMQSCSLWRDGYHNGWDVINAIPERKPYMGYYDEGLTEVADWEIKWLSEHGVDYELYCWFRPTFGDNTPIKTPYSSYALHDGFFKSEYSNSMKFAIMWENGASKAKDSEDFRKNIVPYWIEYYFKDPRYMLINNKPVISVYSLEKMKRDFKDIAGVRAETDYLRQACKNAGFADVIILSSSRATDEKTLKDYVDAGIDTLYTYNWGNMSGYIDTQKVGMESQQKAGIINKMGTFIMGWDDTAWFGKGGRYTTPEEYKQLLQWGRDELMPKMDQNSETKNMVMLGNWNEFGEGHYMMPTELHGFGYLDAVKEVFGGEGGHDDGRPTESQIDRITNMYMTNRQTPLNKINEPMQIPADIKKEWNFDTAGNSEGWTITKQVEGLEVKDGAITGVSIGQDPGIISADNLAIDVSDVTYIKVRMKNGTPDVGGMFYFITENDTAWAENKGIPFYVDPSTTEYKDYYVYAGINKLWTGKLRQIRFDPISTTGSFTIDSISFLSANADGSIKVKLDGKTQVFKDSPKLINGRTMVPMRELFEKIGAVIEWDGETKTVTAVKDKNVIFLRVGLNRAISQQTFINLDQAPVLIDDKMYIPLRFVGEATGAKVEWDDKTQTVSITSGAGAGTGGAKAETVVESNVGRTVWDFKVANNLSGWKPNAFLSDIVVKDGILSAKSIGTDPFMMSADGLALDAKTIKSFNVKMKNSTPSTLLVLYYITNEDTAWGEDKTLRTSIKPNDKNSSEYVIEIGASEKWKGTIKQLRFDMVDKEGSIEIDYIKFITK